MALFEELEPPSFDKTQKTTEKIKNFSRTIQTKNQFYRKIVPFLAKLSEVCRGTSNYCRFLANFLVEIRNHVLALKYFPHYAVVFLAVIISGVNLSQKIAVKAYYRDIINVDPTVSYSVTKTIDPYTPIINDDAGSTEKSILADTNSEGFVSSTGTIATEITDREEPLPDNTSNSVQYVIRSGDTLTGLGWKFDVKLSTIKYVNNIDNENIVRPGVKLTIPKKGYAVSEGLIAKREQDRKAKLAAASRSTVTRNATSQRITVRKNPGSKINGYPYGYCTYYVASRRYVPSSWGDARAWLSSAQRSGYSTGSSPAAGAIVVTRESWWGHVAYVESVNGDSVTISEMNAKGWGVTSSRTISTSDGIVRGYIY